METITIPQADTTEKQHEDAAPALTKVPRNGKLPKIKRSEHSFRPGLSAVKVTPVSPAKPKELIFYLPAIRPRGSSEEAARVQAIAEQLSTHADVGTVTAFGIRNQTWEITMALVQRNAENEDQFLSEVFRALMPTIEVLADLRNGFCVGKTSSWAYRIGAFVADQDSFN
jgi:hypothetical protein